METSLLRYICCGSNADDIGINTEDFGDDFDQIVPTGVPVPEDGADLKDVKMNRIKPRRRYQRVRQYSRLLSIES